MTAPLRRVIALATMTTLLSAAAAAQDLGGLPNLDWRILRGDSVDVITTPATLPFARRALAVDEALVRMRPLRLGSRVVPVDVVVQPVTVVPNGFVGQAPWRSYLYATPPQQQDLLSTSEWVDALAIHEYRHVEQNSALLRGWTRAARIAFGNGGWGVATALSTPDWFMEGDATYFETALTYAGRGRTPAFWALNRALALDSVTYTYQTARNGSFRRRVPNQYPLGLALVTHGRHAYGDPWPQVVRTSGAFWPPFYPFSVGLKRATGLHTPAFYRAAYDSLHREWRGAAFAKTLTLATRLTPLGRQIPRYSHPQPDPTRGPGEVLAVRRSQTRIPQLVRYSADDPEEVIANLGANVDGGFHAAGGRATWSRLRFAERRPNQTYSDVYVADYGTDGRPRRLTEDGRYFSPGLSPDGGRVIAVQRSLAPGRACLAELDAETGERLRSVCYALDLLASPRYTGDGAGVVAIAKRDGYVSLYVLDFGGGARALTPWTRHVIGTPYVTGDRVYFSASFTGVDNVFSVGLGGGEDIVQHTEVPVGAYAPSVRDDRLYFTEVDRRGDPVSVLARADWLRRPVGTIVEPVDLPKYAPYAPDAVGERFRENYIAADVPGDVVALASPPGLGTVAQSVPPVEDAAEGTGVGAPYNALLRGFQVHSVQPLVDNVEASVSLLGENVLSTLRAAATVRYNINEERFRVTGSATVAKTWPWLRVDLGQAGRRYLAIRRDSLAEGQVIPRIQDFDERRLGLRLVAPLQQAVGAYNYSLTPQLALEGYRFADETAATAAALVDGGFVGADIAVSAQRTRTTAPKQLGPREGQLLTVRYSRGLGAGGDGGGLAGGDRAQLNLTVGQFLPGVSRSHSLLLRVHYREESIFNQYQYADRFFYARGYDKAPADRTVTASADYRLPLLYPDVGLAGIVYCRRVRANLWGDLMRSSFDEPLRVDPTAVASVGVDLSADLTLFNVQDLPVGVRLAYRLDRVGDEGAGFAEPQLLLALPF